MEFNTAYYTYSDCLTTIWLLDWFQVLTRQNMEEIVKFAYEHNLFLMADEVYQENVVCKPFYSFKKVIHKQH